MAEAGNSWQGCQQELCLSDLPINLIKGRQFSSYAESEIFHLFSPKWNKLTDWIAFVKSTVSYPKTSTWFLLSEMPRLPRAAFISQLLQPALPLPWSLGVLQPPLLSLQLLQQLWWGSTIHPKWRQMVKNLQSDFKTYWVNPGVSPASGFSTGVALGWRAASAQPEVGTGEPWRSFLSPVCWITEEVEDSENKDTTACLFALCV